MISFECDFECFFDDCSCFGSHCDESCVHFYNCQFCKNYDCDFGNDISVIDFCPDTEIDNKSLKKLR